MILNSSILIVLVFLMFAKTFGTKVNVRSTEKRVHAKAHQTQRKDRRSMYWEYEQDDIFLSYVTAKPTTSNHPTSSPAPSRIHTLSQSYQPSTLTSLQPSVAPSLSRSSHPSDEPSRTPSQTPSQLSSHKPSHSAVPTLVMSTTRISRFTIVLTKSPNSQVINAQDVIGIANVFLDEYFKQNLPKHLRYQGVELRFATSDSRMLQSTDVIPCIGEVWFNLFSPPDIAMINDYVLTAFNEHKNEFLEALTHSEISGLQSLLDVNTKNYRVDNNVTSVHIVVIVVCGAFAIFGIIASFIVNQKQDNVRKHLLRVSEHSKYNRGPTQSGGGSFINIEPLPIQISNDHQTRERMNARARYDRDVMNRANELLSTQQEDPIIERSQSSIRFAPTVVHKFRHNKDTVNSNALEDEFSSCSHSSVFSFSSKGTTSPINSLLFLGFNDVESRGGQQTMSAVLDKNPSSKKSKHNESEKMKCEDNEERSYFTVKSTKY